MILSKRIRGFFEVDNYRTAWMELADGVGTLPDPFWKIKKAHDMLLQPMARQRTPIRVGNIQTGNIFKDVPPNIRQEICETLVRDSGVKIERIVSKGQASKKGFWYDQDQNEWVMVVKGEAKLRFERDDELLTLSAGEYVHIPAHVRHRVEWTPPDTETIWLAVYYGKKGSRV